MCNKGRNDILYSFACDSRAAPVCWRRWFAVCPAGGREGGGHYPWWINSRFSVLLFAAIVKASRIICSQWQSCPSESVVKHVTVAGSNDAPPADNSKEKPFRHNRLVKDLLLHTLKGLSFLRNWSLLTPFLYTASVLWWWHPATKTPRQWKQLLPVCPMPKLR